MTQDELLQGVTPPKPTTKFPRWFTEDYPGRDKDIADDLFAVIYWKIREEKEAEAKKKGSTYLPDKDLAKQSQLFAEALMKAGQDAEGNSAAFEQAFVRIAYSVKRNGYFRMTQDEYSSIEEWLIDKVPAKKGAELSNIMYLINVFIPTVEQVGLEQDELYKLRENWSKTKAAVPVLRSKTDAIYAVEEVYEPAIQEEKNLIFNLSALKTDALPGSPERENLSKEIEERKEKLFKLEKEKEEVEEVARQDFVQTFHKALEVITNPKIPVDGINGVADHLRGNVVCFTGEKCYIAQGGVVYTMVVPTDYELATESMLRNLVSFIPTDGAVIMNSLGNLILHDGVSPRQTNKKEGRK